MNAGGVPNTCKSSGALFSTEHPVKEGETQRAGKEAMGGNAHGGEALANAEEALGHGVLSAEQCLAADG
jgi:hypothetical protein